MSMALPLSVLCQIFEVANLWKGMHHQGYFDSFSGFAPSTFALFEDRHASTAQRKLQTTKKKEYKWGSLKLHFLLLLCIDFVFLSSSFLVFTVVLLLFRCFFLFGENLVLQSMLGQKRMKTMP